MYDIGELVYVYTNELEKSILMLPELTENRFGILIDISEVNVDNENRRTLLYTIKLYNNKEIKVNTYDNTFKIYNVSQLKNSIIYNENLDKDKKDRIIMQIQKKQNYYDEQRLKEYN